MTGNITHNSPTATKSSPPLALPNLLDGPQSQPVVFYLDAVGLWERHCTRTYLYLRPGPGFGVWCFDGAGWFEHLPNWPLITANGKPAAFMSDQAEEDVPQREVELIYSWPEMENQETREELQRREQLRQMGPAPLDEGSRCVASYVDTLNDGAKEAIRHLAHFQWCALEAASLVDGFEAFLERTVSRFGPNLFNLAWSLSAALERSKSWRLHVARQLIGLSPRQFLIWITSRKIALRPMGVVGKISAVPRQISSLRSLANILANSAKVRRLNDAARIDATLLPALDIAPDWFITPRLLRLMSRIRHYHITELEYNLGVAARTITKPAHIFAFVKYLEGARNADTFYTRLDNELLHFDWANSHEYLTPAERARAPFPEPPFPSDEVFTAISSAKHLKRVGRFMRNCLATFEASIRSGSSYAYEWKTEPRIALILSHNEKRASWALEQIGTIENAALPDDVGSRLKELLQPRLEMANSLQSANR